ncbi:MAG: HAMP domain-containing protein [Peptococcaceae bacterium]|nr:HAMP domain-containing protein [Peptococcaceae bacterium]
MFRVNKTIFRKLFFTYLLLIIAVMSVIAFAFSWGYNNYVFTEKQADLRSAAAKTAMLIESYRNEQISSTELNHSLDILSYMTGSRIYAIKLTKESLQNEKLIMDQDYIDGYLFEDLKNILNGQEVTRKKQYSDRMDGYVVFVGEPLHNQTGIEGAILLFAPIDQFSAQITLINLTIWLSALVAVFVSSFLIYSISQKISRPLRVMEEGARKIAAGEQIEDLVVQTGDELDKMAQAFNSMKNKITAAENMRREFIASVSHDLKTPLTTINGFVQGMLDGLVKPEENTKYLKIIKEETQRLIGLTGDILELAKLQSGGINLQRKYFNLKELLEKTLESTGFQCNTKKTLISMDCPENIELYADEERFRQILINILDNAFKFTPENGEIILKASQLEREICLRIKDNGQGIAPDDLPYIFEKFYRGDKSRQESTGGTGLGLNIVKMLVESHGGRIEAQSVLGQGTEFILFFPK